MSVKLEAIKLNYDTSSVSTDALNIRKNEAEAITVPEWRRGVTSSPKDSLAAYSIKETSGNLIRIQAKFSRADPQITSAEIRAVDPSNARLQGCLYELLRRLGITPTVPPPYGNCLGEVKARSVSFLASGETGFELFDLQPVWSLGSFALGIHPVTWQWQYRLQPSDPWCDFEKSYHTIYLVLETPTAPWQQAPYSSTNIQLPWTAALDRACLWAHGAKSKDQAAAMITRAVNTQPLQSYTPWTLFGFQQYYLSSYLRSLDAGQSFQLNCTDCADAVTTFANLLGCNLVEGRFFDIKTRKFLTLNGNPAVEADWVSWDWGYHEICWLDTIDQYGLIYDGCLQVDMDDNYGDLVHIARLPIKMRFGMSDPNDYRYRLVESGSAELEDVARHRPVA